MIMEKDKMNLDKNTILEVNNLNVNYKNSKFKVSDVSFSIPRGCIVGLIGENGAGKTTIINSILGLQKIESGEIKIFGRNFDINDTNLKAKIGVSFSETYLNKNLKIFQVEKIYKGLYKNWDSDYFNFILEKFRISKTKKISECSSGMQKILSIALSLSYNPQLLIFDEPTTTLDPVRRKDILGIFQEFVLDENKTVIFSSHITTDIEQIADIIIYIRQGKVQFVEDSTKLLHDNVLVRCLESNFKNLNLDNVIAYEKTAQGYEVIMPRDRISNLDNIVVDSLDLEKIMSMYSKGVVMEK
jgi:ABC-2 type transport system ATP-binding protein